MLGVRLYNLLILQLIAVEALFQLLSKAVSKAGKSDSSETSSSPKPQTRRPIERAPRESDADRIRKFLEALGQPPSSTPPPPILPRTDIPPRPVAPVQPPPVIMPRTWRLPREDREKSDVGQRKTAPLEQQSRSQQIVPPRIPPAATPAFEVHEQLSVELQQRPSIDTPIESYAAATQAVAERTDLKMNLATLLASRSSLRDAILLRELLGTPRVLQGLDIS